MYTSIEAFRRRIYKSDNTVFILSLQFTFWNILYFDCIVGQSMEGKYIFGEYLEFMEQL